MSKVSDILTIYCCFKCRFKFSRIFTDKYHPDISLIFKHNYIYIHMRNVATINILMLCRYSFRFLNKYAEFSEKQAIFV